jgi:Bacterial phospho-glucose isomerase C-terminal SIS domain
VVSWFDESRLDDEEVLAGIDESLRALAETGARVRREASEAQSAITEAVARTQDSPRPRAVLAAGPDSRLLRAVLEPWCPVPFVAWPSPNLPGWAGSLDLVVVLAPDGHGAGVASAVAEAVRRGCQVVVACPAGSQVAEHAAGRWSSVLPTVSRDQLATAVVVLEYLERVALGPRTDAEAVATALDQVATECSPFRDLAVNPAKMLAIAMADTNPVVWGGSVLAARAARRIAESIRRASGRGAIAGDAEHLLPVLEAARPVDTFADPFADGPASGERRPMLLVLDDGSEEAVVREERGRLQAAAAARGVRVERLTTDAPTEVARYASLYLSGSYAAQYLHLGLVDD